MNQDLLIHASQAARAQAHGTANAILNAPIHAEHALKVYLTGKAQVFEAALQAVRGFQPRGPLDPALVRVAEQAARSVHWLG